MRTTVLALLMALLFLLGQVGCSEEKQQTKTDTPAKTTTPQQNVAIQPNYDSLATVTASIRNEDNQFATLVTSFGNLTLELYHDVAPAHADSFIARTRDGFYDSSLFYRVIDRFMIQAGDPTGTGAGKADYTLNAEFSEMPHIEGTLSMARAMDPNSASTQFFICLDRNRLTSSLDRKYTVFGHLIKGYDVLHRIGSVACGPNPGNPTEISRPKEDVHLIRAYASDAEGNESR